MDRKAFFGAHFLYIFASAIWTGRVAVRADTLCAPALSAVGGYGPAAAAIRIANTRRLFLYRALYEKKDREITA